ncbi:DUF6894 family protein [Bradyrhizobium sp. DOA9]|uniref:DUF6894 family protein n=1 Tax=Bradyrhizobium sp. DOA9 TaxID=1126627 RepID=UPI00072310A2|nr:hypothetical protein BDOA9_0159280 [Bradyrhizobium sp. DOA9]
MRTCPDITSTFATTRDWRWTRKAWNYPARAVQAEAAKSVADLARDALLAAKPTGDRRELAIEVRDAGGPVMQVKFNFQIEDLRWRALSRAH